MRRPYLSNAGWGVLVVAILVLGHGIVLYHLASRLAWVVAVGLIVLVLLKHVGLFTSIYAIFKRGSRDST